MKRLLWRSGDLKKPAGSLPEPERGSVPVPPSWAGYYFGNIPVVKDNFTLVILAIIIISLLPGVYEFLRARKEKQGVS